MEELFDHNNLPDRIIVRVTPKAKFNCIKKESSADGTPLYKVYVTVAPEDGKANQAVLKLLAKAMGIAKSNLAIIRGETHRDKVITITRN